MKWLSRIYLVLAALFLVAGVGLWVWLGVTSLTVEGVAIFLSPGVVFLIAWWVSRRVRVSLVHWIAIPLTGGVIYYWLVTVFGVVALSLALAEVTNVKRYDEIVERWADDMVYHFPRPIPADAQDVLFSFQPGFVGSHIQLRYSTTSDTIAALYEHFSEQATVSFNGGNYNDHVNAEGGIATTSFYTSDSDYRTFPSDYEVMSFDPGLIERKGGGYYSLPHGVAISRQRNEIVYWAEYD